MNKATSLRYRALSGMFRAIKVNKMLDKQGDEFDTLLNEYRKKQKKPLKIPYKKMCDKFDVDIRSIDGVTCYVVRQKNTAPDKGVLYLFGGGYILPPDPGDIVLCGQIAENCNAEVWFPLYPMAPDNDLVQTLQGTLGVYRDILDHYDADRIRFFGTSSGGGQALSLCMYIRHEGLDVPLPGRLVLQSPGLQVPPSDKQRAEMDRLSHLDVMIPPGFFDNIAPVLAKGDDAYLLSPILFDLTGFPPIDIFYGTNEVMFAYLDDFRAKCSECGVELNVHIGEGMMHCWGAMDFVPEAKAVRQEYFKAIGNETREICVHEYGDPADPLIVLLAPMLLSGEDMYNIVSPHLEGKYFIVAPDQGGHGDAGRYVSAESEYRELKEYLVSKGYTDIKLLYGASLGVAIAYRLFEDKDFNIEKAWFDGVALNRNAAFAESFMKNLFRRRKKMLAKTHAEASPNLVEMYGYEFAKRMTANFARITLYDIDNICYACCHYDLKTFTTDQQKRLHLEYGSKDFDLKLSKKAIRKYLPEAVTVIRDGYPHCGYMAAHTAEYVKEMERWIGTRRNNMDLKFGDVQETALITLAIRASETARADARISDPAAKEIIDTLGVDVSKYDPFLSHEGVVARTIMYRDALKSLIAQYPDAVCINLGCGFDDKFPQVDNGKIRWYDVDLADQIAVRRKVFEDRERCTMMDGDALDGAWTKSIPESDMYIIVMEGVLEYFSKEQVKTCLNMLCDSFNHGYLLAELHAPFVAKNSKHHDAVKHTNATFGWGTKSGEEYLELEPRMSLISETSYNEEMKKHTIRGKLFAIIGKNLNNRLAIYKW